MNLGNIKDHGTLVGGLEGSGGNDIIGLSDLMDEDVVMDGSHTSQAAAGSVMHSDSFNGKFGDLNGKSKEPNKTFREKLFESSNNLSDE